MNISEKIKLLRKKSKLTQKQLSELSGIPVRTIQRYEAGDTHPQKESIQKLAKALNVPEIEFIEFWGEVLFDDYQEFEKQQNNYKTIAKDMIENGDISKDIIEAYSKTRLEGVIIGFLSAQGTTNRELVKETLNYAYQNKELLPESRNSFDTKENIMKMLEDVSEIPGGLESIYRYILYLANTEKKFDF